MSVIEIQGGPLTHRYLVRKRKDDLAAMVGDYRQALGQPRETPDPSKHTAAELSHMILALAWQLP